MKFIIGLVGSGKTTLYRQLNEQGMSNAIELEYPPIMRNNEDFKQKMFDLLYNTPEIDTIIAHPIYLPKNFFDIISQDDTVRFLDISIEERIRRIKQRTQSLNIQQVIFDDKFLIQEECLFYNIKEQYKIWKK